jgi:hypothetical protein
MYYEPNHVVPIFVIPIQCIPLPEEHCYAYVHDVHKPSLPPCKDAQTQTPFEGPELDRILQEHHNMKRRLEDKETLRRELFLEKVMESDSTILQYTGIPNAHYLNGLFDIVKSKTKVLKYWRGQDSAKSKNYEESDRQKPGPQRKLSAFEEFVLTMVRLRLGLLGFVLGDMFGVSETRVSQIFTTWINFLFQVFKPLIKWPSKEKAKKHMPASYKKHYPKTRAIIDCTEFFTEKATNVNAQKKTYSSYKSHNTDRKSTRLNSSH